MYKLDIKIDALPKRINQQSGKHWSFRFAETKKWMELMTYAIGQNKPTEPLKKAKLTLMRCSSKPPDYDGLVQSFKVNVDCLIKLGIIIDDNMEIIGKPEYGWTKVPAGKGFVIITVEEDHN